MPASPWCETWLRSSQGVEAGVHGCSLRIQLLDVCRPHRALTPPDHSAAVCAFLAHLWVVRLPVDVAMGAFAGVRQDKRVDRLDTLDALP